MHPLEKKYHETLARYFMEKPLFFDPERKERPNVRKCHEQPYQQTTAEMRDEATETLTDLWFIEAKVRCDLLEDLQKDYTDIGCYRSNHDHARLRFYESLLRLKSRILVEHTDAVFQVLYNELRWSDEKEYAEEVKAEHLDSGRTLFIQTRKPDIKKSCLRYTISSFNDLRECVVSNDGSTVFTLGVDSEGDRFGLSAWDTATGREIKSVKFEISEKIKNLRISSNDELLLLNRQTEVNTMMVISIRSFSIMKTLHGDNENSFDKVVFSHDCSLIAAFDHCYYKKDNGGEIRIWDIASGNLIHRVKNNCGGVHDCIFTSNSRGIISANTDRTVRTWDLSSETVQEAIPDLPEEVKALEFTRDFRHLMLRCESKILFWDFQKKAMWKSIQSDFPYVGSAVIARDKSILLVMNSPIPGTCVSMWDMRECRKISCVQPEKNRRILKITNNTLGIIIDEKTYDISIMDLEKNKITVELSGHGAKVTGCFITPDNRYVVSFSKDQTVRVWDLSLTDQCITSLIAYRNDFEVKISPDNAVTASAGELDTVKLWDNFSKKVFAVSDEKITRSMISRYMEFTPDAGSIAVATSLRTLSILDIHDCRQIAEINYSNDITWDWAFSPDCRIGILGAHFMTWAEGQIFFFNTEKGIPLGHFNGHKGDVKIITVSSDGTLLASGGDDFFIRLWDLKSFQEKGKIERGTSASQIKFMPDNVCLAISPGDDFGRSGGSFDVILRNLRREEEIRIYPSKKHIETECFVSPDGRSLAMVNREGDLEIYGVSRKRIRTRLRINEYWPYESGMRPCVFSPDGNFLILTNERKRLSLFNLQSGEYIAEFISEYPCCSFDISSDGNLIVCGDKGGNLYFLNIEGITFGPLIQTAVRLWLFDEKDAPGSWARDVTFRCPRCNVLSPTDKKVLNAVSSINRDCGIGPDDSPCLKLPDEAWEDARLLGECPRCGGKLKFNPFVVDNRDRF